MSNVHRFSTATKNTRTGELIKFHLAVKAEFLEKCPKPHELDTTELNTKFYMFKFLHNPNGPAIVREACGEHPERREFWLDGRSITKEDPDRALKMEHDINFNNKLEDVLK